MRIVFFNHKGGVSKTTSAFHIGWMLAQRGSRILLVDADPQCNLTSLVMQEDYVPYYTNPQTRENNIKDGVSSAFEGKPSPIEHVTCYQAPRNGNLFLLPGHPNLSELEPTLSFAQSAPNAFSTMQNLPGSFNALIEKTSTQYNIDYVLIDLNPSVSAINQNLFSISDLFIIPTNPDPFSIMAIKTLASLLPRWYRSANEWKTAFVGSTYPFPDINPKLGGILIQRYNVRNGRAATPFQNSMDEIYEEVNTTLRPALIAANMTYSQAIYQGANIDVNLCLGEIPDFQSLQQQSQYHGIPVFSLSDQEIDKKGVVLDQMIEKRTEFFNLFTNIVGKIEFIKANADG